MLKIDLSIIWIYSYYEMSVFENKMNNLICKEIEIREKIIRNRFLYVNSSRIFPQSNQHFIKSLIDESYEELRIEIIKNRKSQKNMRDY